MRKITARGRAHDDRETLVFTIEPSASGGFLLSIRYYGDGTTNLTGGGVWPSIAKAKQIAEESANRLLHGAGVDWREQAH